MYRVQQHVVRLASDSYTEHTEAEASQALGDCVAWLDCSAPLCHCCALLCLYCELCATREGVEKCIMNFLCVRF